MDEQLQNGVSAISEISANEGGSRVYHFAASLGWGTLFGSLSLVAAILLLDLPEIRFAELFAGLFFFGIFVGLFTLAGLVVIGLPVTFLLSISEEEHQLLYAALGGFSGFAAMLILFGQGSSSGPEELLFAVPGGLAGFASAWRWGGWREELAARCAHNPIPYPQPED